MNQTAVMSPPPEEPVIVGACPHDCPDTCSLLTTVQDGVAVSVRGNPDHPATAGVLCTKVSRYTERTYHPERLLTPLKRVGKKGEGRFEPVSWDEALDDIAQRLQAIAADDPQAVLPYSYAGTMGQVQRESMAARFFNRLGASQLDRTICSSAGSAGLAHTYGAPVGMHMAAFAQAKLILIWGSNAIASNLHFWRHVQAAKRDGAKVICIDPRLTETAEKCHQHIALLPGTDAALALGLMNELIANDWLDHDYIEQHTSGWNALKARALAWPVERAAKVCGISPEEITGLAYDYAHSEAPAIRLNYGMQRTRGGGNAVRAVACLPALVGAWRHASGGLLLSSAGYFPTQKKALERPDLLAKGLPGRTPRVINMATIGADLNRDSDAAFGPKVQALIVYNSNPVAIAPDSPQVVKGFARDDLFTVVLEHFKTDTADYADYVLPATTQLEHWDIHASYGHTDVLLNRPAIAPHGEARTNTDVFRALAQRMGFDEPCFSDTDEDLCTQAFDPAVVSWSLLCAQGFAPLPLSAAPFANGGFPTPSGKCTFESPGLAAIGQDPVPDYLPNWEPPNVDARYPLAMISPPARNFLNSTFANVKSLRDIEGEALVEISSVDAQARGINDGDEVAVFNDRGRYVCVARVSKRARVGVVNGLGIWWRKLGLRGTNVNEVTSQALTDLGRAPTFYDCAVEVARVA
ncbi:MAG: molybdopterin oxidoreductase family protein [Burkholderiaceae bacterium]|nr:molybdopterin oxidoreductase family protein [Burkholderiaceae bacterium]